MVSYVERPNEPHWRSIKPATAKTKVTFRNGVPWRPPTNYGRTACRWRYVSGVKTERYHNGVGWRTRTTTGVDTGGIHIQDIEHPNGAIAFGWEDVQTLVECMNRLNDSKVSLGEYLAESVKSAEMLAGAGQELLSALLLAKKGQWGAIPKKFGWYRDRLSNYYLQYEYGWKPLCSDLHQLLENAQKGLSYPQLLHATKNQDNVLSAKWTHYGLQCEGTMNVKNNCTVYAEVRRPDLVAAQAYRTINPAALTWNLIPYSFVVDWFMPIGNFLEHLSAKAGLGFVAATQSQVRTSIFDIKLPTGTCKANKTYMQRKVLNDFPRAYIPYAKANPFNTKRVAVTTALLSQLFGHAPNHGRNPLR